MIKRRNKKGGKIATLEIILLILSVVAFSYMLGSSFPVVGAQTPGKNCVFGGDGKEWRISGDTLTSGTEKISTDTFCQRYSYLCEPPPTSGYIIKSSVKTTCFEDFQTPTTQTTKPIATLPTSLRQDYLGPLRTGLGILPGETGGVPDEVDLSKCLVIEDEECVEWAPGAGPAAEVAKKASFFNKPFLGKELSIKSVLGNFVIAAAIWQGTNLVKDHIPGVSPALAQALGHSISVGVFAGRTATQILGAKGGLLGIGAGAPTIIGLGVALVYFVFSYKETRYQQVTFTCSPWVAPFGGSDCGKCNTGEFPCTEYQCKSLGQGCEIINSGTEDALCVWRNSQDNKPPIINAWEKVLTLGHKYSPESVSSPPDRGVRVVSEESEDGCVEPWTQLTVGITLNEPAICKLSEKNANSFENMENNYWSGGISKQNHSFQFSVPSPELMESKNITLKNGGEFALYTRCVDTNGQENIGNFVFRYCVGRADLTEPQIYATSIFNNSHIGFEETSTDLRVYVNEPVECKWSRIDQDYDAMENEMSCAQGSVQFDKQIVYPCSTTLTGLNDYPAENDYYFKCRDQPELIGTDKETDRRTNGESYLFRLLGSRALSITSIEPNGTISDSTEPIKVTLKAETFAGAEEGAALCYFSEAEDSGFVEFVETGTHEHSQDLYLAQGDYTYYVKCVDSGGNSETKSTRFTVEADTETPVIVRAFHEENYLRIITNEEASCVYSTSTQNSCTYLFEDGLQMTSLENNKHQTNWDSSKTFYIKCQDEFGNKPDEDACSIVVSPYAIR